MRSVSALARGTGRWMLAGGNAANEDGELFLFCRRAGEGDWVKLDPKKAGYWGESDRPYRRWHLGDIAIAPAVAQRNARKFGRTFDDDMRILILHGMLHLMGYDHETDNGQMDRREQRVRRALGLA